jgi:hypothetical protein
MPNNSESTVTIEEYDEEVSGYGPDDFGFILGPNGELKSFMLPEHMMDNPPEEVLAILSIFGVDDIHELTNSTLH